MIQSKCVGLLQIYTNDLQTHKKSIKHDMLMNIGYEISGDGSLGTISMPQIQTGYEWIASQLKKTVSVCSIVQLYVAVALQTSDVAI